MLLILALCAAILCSVSNVQAHSGPVAIAVPVEGIVVDGDLSDWPQGMIRYPLAYDPYQREHFADSTDFVGDFRVAYDPENNLLYVAVEAGDDFVVPDAGDGEILPWSQDSCELFLELSHNQDKVRPVQYFLRGPTLEVYGRELRAEAEVVAKAQWAEQGWQVEWAVDIGQLSQGEVELASGMGLGFDIMVFDNDAGEEESDRFIAWSVGADKFLNSNALGDLILTAPGFAFDDMLHQINAVTVQSRSASEDRIKTSTTIDALLLTAALVLALVHLFLYCFYSQVKENLHFAIFAACLGWFLTPYDLEWMPWPEGMHTLFFWGWSIFGLRFLYEIFYPQMPRQFKYFVMGIILWGIVINVLDNYQSTIFLGLIVFAEMTRVAVQAIRKKKSGAWILGVGFIAMILPFVSFLALSAIIQLGMMAGIPRNSLMTASLTIAVEDYITPLLDAPWSTLALVLSMSIYLARNVARTNKDLTLQLEQVKTLSQRAVEDERQRVLLEAENERQSQELEEARKLQLSMLPQVVPESPHCEIAWQMETATEVGGDYYDYNLAADGTLTLTLGDATGHGLQSGTIVTATKSLFLSLAGNPSIAETFTVMSRSLKDMNLKRMGMAMAMLKLRGNALQVASAGIPPMLLYRAATGEVEEVELAGMPLGLSTAFPYQEREFVLATGDTLVLMSDGLPERLNAADDELGYERMQALFADVADWAPVEICVALARGGEDWAAGRAQDDDVTLVVLRMK